MKIYTHYQEGTNVSQELADSIVKQIKDTVVVWRDTLLFDHTRFVVDGNGNLDDLALFPAFYQEDSHAISVIDKNQENTFYLTPSRYTLMYVWELADIESGADSDNVAYQAFTLEDYDEDMNSVHTDGYVYLGKYEVLTNKLTIDFNHNEER